MTNERIEELALLLELHHGSEKLSDSIGMILYGEKPAVFFNDGLFGLLSKLSIIIKKYVDTSWYDNKYEEDYENSIYKLIVENDKLSWNQKAEILVKNKMNYLMSEYPNEYQIDDDIEFLNETCGQNMEEYQKMMADKLRIQVDEEILKSFITGGCEDE